MKKYTKAQMAEWILNNYVELLPILKECEKDDAERKARADKLLAKAEKIYKKIERKKR